MAALLDEPRAGLTTKLNALSVVLLFAVALPVKEIVVSEPTSFGLPEITPPFDNDNPAFEIFVPPVSE